VPPTHQPDFVLGPHGVASAVNRHDSLFEVDRRSSTRADKATVVSLLLLLDRRLCSGCGLSASASRRLYSARSVRSRFAYFQADKRLYRARHANRDAKCAMTKSTKTRTFGDICLLLGHNTLNVDERVMYPSNTS